MNWIWSAFISFLVAETSNELFPSWNFQVYNSKITHTSPSFLCNRPASVLVCIQRQTPVWCSIGSSVASSCPTGFFALTGLAGLGLVLKTVSCSACGCSWTFFCSCLLRQNMGLLHVMFTLYRVEVMNFTLSLRFSSSRSWLSSKHTVLI